MSAVGSAIPLCSILQPAGKLQRTCMSRYRNFVVGAVMAGSIGSLGSIFAPLFAQTTSFRNYRCADGTQFLIANYPYDSRIYLQIDGGPATLERRFSIWGRRYSGGGVTLKFSRTGRDDGETSRKAGNSVRAQLMP